MLIQRRINVVSTLFQRIAMLFWRCLNVGVRRCINVAQNWKTDVGFSFIFNVVAPQRSNNVDKQRWSDVEMLAEINKITTKWLVN